MSDPRFILRASTGIGTGFSLLQQDSTVGERPSEMPEAPTFSRDITAGIYGGVQINNGKRLSSVMVGLRRHWLYGTYDYLSGQDSTSLRRLDPEFRMPMLTIEVSGELLTEVSSSVHVGGFATFGINTATLLGTADNVRANSGGGFESLEADDDKGYQPDGLLGASISIGPAVRLSISESWALCAQVGLKHVWYKDAIHEDTSKRNSGALLYVIENYEPESSDKIDVEANVMLEYRF